MELPSRQELAGSSWRLTQRERIWVSVGAVVIIAFGALIERRTALHRTPMTDLGVFSCAACAAHEGKNIYHVSDWHGWHYQYPPMLAILFRPLAHPLPTPPEPLPPDQVRTAANTPWGYGVPGASRFFGLHKENARFFVIVATWYSISIGLFLLSAHALACLMERRRLAQAPPVEPGLRRRWWGLRLIPLLICGGSVGTELSRGQVDVVMLAAIALALYLTGRGARFAAGAFLSIPAAIKLFPPLLLLYPLWRREWRMAFGVAAGLALAVAVLPAVTLGPTRTVECYQTWFEVLVKPGLGHGTDSSRTTELTGMSATDNQSLLAFLHNWQYRGVARENRPSQAAPWARRCSYAIGAVLLGVMLVAFARRRQDSAPELLVLSGLLIGLGFLISPVVHNYYYILLMPLVTALLAHRWSQVSKGARAGWLNLPLALVVFMTCDLVARLPGIGAVLRDWGLPMLSMLFLMATGVALLLQAGENPVVEPVPVQA
jgi:hypothetical protein